MLTIVPAITETQTETARYPYLTASEDLTLPPSQRGLRGLPIRRRAGQRRLCEMGFSPATLARLKAVTLGGLPVFARDEF